LAKWVPLRDEYLAEFLCLEGRGAVALDFCPACPRLAAKRAANPLYRCTNCFSLDLVCASCCLRLHRIEVSGISLVLTQHDSTWGIALVWGLGLWVQLGHSIFSTCGTPVPGHQEFTVLHTNGLHRVAVDFCGCAEWHLAGTPRQQLLRMSWFPS
ncbi:hypothetical protein C8R44DRAFT_528985, partial [Mycena epipterygia]